MGALVSANNIYYNYCISIDRSCQVKGDTMKKLMFALFAVVFAACSPAAKQTDFYGTWIAQNEKVKVEYIFDTATLTTITTQLNEAFAFFYPPQRVVWEIFSWETTANDDAETKTYYPQGVKIGVRGVTALDTATFFISRDKNSIYKTTDKTTPYYKDTFLHTQKQKIFYGTWRSWKYDFIINESQFTIKEYEDSENIKTNTYVINTWNYIINDNTSFYNDFPFGYIFDLKDFKENIKITLFLDSREQSYLLYMDESMIFDKL